MKEIVLYGEQGTTAYGCYEISLTVKIPECVNHKIKCDYSLMSKIKTDVLSAMIMSNEGTEEEIRKNREILSIFPEPIFVEEIPNQYCQDWCCRHKPWFVVTTKAGRIKIGRRKSVWSIDFSETLCKKTADELFPEENVTKVDKKIHAWSIDKAKEYINKIIASI